jgi:DNA polymerase (family 10)/putative hydrolase
MINDIRSFKDYFFTGEWHIHTKYTDGKNSVEEYCSVAEELGIPLLAFTEHVRKNMTYDFSKLLEDIKKAQGKYPNLILLSGCETKVLSNGELDAEDALLDKVDYKLFAFHSFPPDKELFINALIRALSNTKVHTWAHPGLFLKNKNLNLTSNELRYIFEFAYKNKKYIEYNLKYKLPNSSWLNMMSKQMACDQIIIGGDIHSIEQMCNSKLEKEKIVPAIFAK